MDLGRKVRILEVVKWLDLEVIGNPGRLDDEKVNWNVPLFK